MLGKTVGLDIIEDTMTAVLVKGGLQGHQIMGCAATSISRSGSREAALVCTVRVHQPDVGAPAIRIHVRAAKHEGDGLAVR